MVLCSSLNQKAKVVETESKNLNGVLHSQSIVRQEYLVEEAEYK